MGQRGDNEGKCLYCGKKLPPKVHKWCGSWCKNIANAPNENVRKKALARKEELFGIDGRIKLYIENEFTLETMHEIMEDVDNKKITRIAKRKAKEMGLWLFRDPPNSNMNTSWGEKLKYNKALQKKAGWKNNNEIVRTHYQSAGVKRGRYIK